MLEFYAFIAGYLNKEASNKDASKSINEIMEKIAERPGFFRKLTNPINPFRSRRDKLVDKAEDIDPVGIDPNLTANEQEWANAYRQELRNGVVGPARSHSFLNAEGKPFDKGSPQDLQNGNAIRNGSWKTSTPVAAPPVTPPPVTPPPVTPPPVTPPPVTPPPVTPPPVAAPSPVTRAPVTSTPPSVAPPVAGPAATHQTSNIPAGATVTNTTAYNALQQEYGVDESGLNKIIANARDYQKTNPNVQNLPNLSSDAVQNLKKPLTSVNLANADPQAAQDYFRKLLGENVLSKKQFAGVYNNDSNFLAAYPQAFGHELSHAVDNVTDTPRERNNMADYNTYLNFPQEMRARIAPLKRAYRLYTGKDVNSQEDAAQMLEWAKTNPDKSGYTSEGVPYSREKIIEMAPGLVQNRSRNLTNNQAIA